MELAVWVSYKNLYSDETELSLETIIHALPATAIFQRLAYINSQLHLNERDLSVQSTLFSFWMDFLEEKDQEDLKKRILTIHEQIDDKKLMIFTNISSMMLAQRAIENINVEDRANLTSQEELLFLKAYFMANDILDEKQKDILNPSKIKFCWSTLDQFIHTQILLLIAQSELIEHKNFVIQIIKGVKFFKYIERSEEFTKYLNGFIENLGFESWQNYLLRIADIYGNLIKNKEGGKSMKHWIIVDPTVNAIISFFDSMSVNFNINQHQLERLNTGQIFDYKIFRENPLFKVSSNEYCFLNHNFFIDKFYEALNFQFYNYIHTIKNYQTNYQGFKGKLSSEFSEQTLFFDIMEAILPGDDIKVKGTEYDYEYSDYYVRISNQIFLFEFKDYLLKAEIKHSYNFDIVSKELKTKYIDEHGAVQLIQDIHKIENREILFDKVIKFQRLNNYIVFPIIVFTDYALNVTGINYMLNREFTLLKNQKKFKMKVNNLIFMDLNTLIEFQELFINGNLNLLELCKEYLDYVNSKKISREPLQELTSFSEFINLQIDKLGIEKIPPKMFETSLKELFI